VHSPQIKSSLFLHVGRKLESDRPNEEIDNSVLADDSVKKLRRLVLPERVRMPGLFFAWTEPFTARLAITEPQALLPVRTGFDYQHADSQRASRLRSCWRAR